MIAGFGELGPISKSGPAKSDLISRRWSTPGRSARNNVAGRKRRRLEFAAASSCSLVMRPSSTRLLVKS